MKNILISSGAGYIGPIPTFSNHLVKNICSSIIKKNFQVKCLGLIIKQEMALV